MHFSLEISYDWYYIISESVSSQAFDIQHGSALMFRTVAGTGQCQYASYDNKCSIVRTATMNGWGILLLHTSAAFRVFVCFATC
eukprot:g61181.t1